MDLLLTSSTNAAQRATQGIAIMYYAIGITCQTFLYGIYTSLAIFSIYSMIKTGLKNSMRKYLFIMSIFMFFISTLYWISKLLDLLQKIQNGIIDNNPPSTSLTTSPITHFELILGSVALMNYALTDGVVLWRAWAICSDEYRSWLYVPLFFLCCACTTISATIIVRITIQSIPHVDGSTSDPRIKKLTRAIDVFQTSNLGLSLLMNLSATGLIALKAWRFRRWIKFDLKAIPSRRRRTRTRGEKVMVLLIESGVIYCISIVCHI
ncbi:hypothetical protein E1B28_009413 [Marasmius oreades]|uniref:Uncharacterized protein n=1 Tax=Marasmius oreades TaxID=181124 RepID=A0A9P7S0Y5_9AGAR|nr:uncharacterized protein E1B28_009413 [Marasmius oreades]KAG7093128.1 hypothetical protein E1B28_009413 [Marasmius oreades]